MFVCFGEKPEAIRLIPITADGLVGKRAISVDRGLFSIRTAHQPEAWVLFVSLFACLFFICSGHLQLLLKERHLGLFRCPCDQIRKRGSIFHRMDPDVNRKGKWKLMHHRFQV